jgi:hypothetical protein
MNNLKVHFYAFYFLFQQPRLSSLPSAFDRLFSFQLIVSVAAKLIFHPWCGADVVLCLPIAGF